MIELRKSGYDSQWDLVKCEVCKKEIAWDESKILLGTGNSLVLVYHADCYERIVGESEPQAARDR